MVWIRTPYEVAHRRGLERELTVDQRVEKCPKKMQKAISHHHQALDLPEAEETCLEINGQSSFLEQLRQFCRFFASKHERVNIRSKNESLPVWFLLSINLDKQIIVVMLGVPGSGKSFFARQLAAKLNWQRSNRVETRKELFGSQAALKIAG